MPLLIINGTIDYKYLLIIFIIDDGNPRATVEIFYFYNDNLNVYYYIIIFVKTGFEN